MKDCTFVPKINKEPVFKSKRRSNSVQGVMNDIPQMDPYYQKLNELFGKKSLDQDLAMGPMPSVDSGRIDMDGDQVPKKRASHSPQRHQLLYNTQKVYEAKKELLKKEVSDEEKKVFTYQPQLYRSKVKPNRALNYQIYQKRSNLPKDIEQKVKLRESPNERKNKPKDVLDKFMSQKDEQLSEPELKNQFKNVKHSRIKTFAEFQKSNENRDLRDQLTPDFDDTNA